MGIGTAIVKGVKFAVKLPFYNSNKMLEARKAVKGSVFSKAKAKAALDVLKNDYRATTVEPTIGKSLKKIGSKLLKPFKMTGKAIGKFFKKGGAKVVGKWLGKVAKTAGKALKGIPILGTLIAIGCEIPGIVKSFKEGGFWKGMAHIGLSAVKIGVATAASIGATIVGGPVAGAAAYLLVDAGLSWVQGKIMDTIPNNKPQNNDTQDVEISDNQEQPVIDNETGNVENAVQTQITDQNETVNTTGSVTTDNFTEDLRKRLASVQANFNPDFGFNNFGYQSFGNPFGIGLGFNNFGMNSINPFGLGFGQMANPYALNLKI